ncbi:carboxylating nicotinate-nucleotide diphosphorylase [Methylocella silvestris]|uniref:Probable nicotinate-nucleotide pyrophosphorylase [carboxylating] n=1 Tax=Methylocella silvestris TaxID=199596 RepID=A0A2J7TJH7_METSI|nr:carboxylating nicotinate-nucleotide diphosphorylase [Methylocella silvestris]PNG26916.1 nicotinate-nucleotide diphosphorylase (carboxylating) [Methylocella silvestris]
MLAPLPRLLIEPLVRGSLLEDLGQAGDVTSNAIAPASLNMRAVLAARQQGVVAGLDLARLAFELIDPRIFVRIERQDGSSVAAGDRIAVITGPARGVLAAERTALNFLSHLSGVATATASVVAAVKGYKARIVCTRKTTPGLRAVEKYAVRAGGGANHRFGLDDALLIKDNHVAIAGGVAEALRRAKAAAGHLVKIELEVDTLQQLIEAMEEGVDVVLLDNMTPDMLTEAVRIVAGRAVTEASGRITTASAPAVAASGVDVISLGWLTHSAPILDIGLDFEP